MGGGVNLDNARGYLDAGASHVIVTSVCQRSLALLLDPCIDISSFCNSCAIARNIWNTFLCSYVLC